VEGCDCGCGVIRILSLQMPGGLKKITKNFDVIATDTSQALPVTVTKVYLCIAHLAAMSVGHAL
jgi:hypothetical protein